MPRVRARSRTAPTHSAMARSTTALTAGLLFLFGSAGCAPPPAPQPSAPAAAHPDLRPSAAPLLGDVLQRINERGSVRSTVRGDLGFVGELAGEGLVRYAHDHADVTLQGTTKPNAGQPPQPVDLALIDGVGYLKSPLLQPEPGKPWLRLAADGTDFAAKLLAPALGHVQDSTDPRATFTGIESATKIESSAPDQVDGAPATRYSLRVLTAEAADTAPAEQQRTRLRSAADAGRGEIGYELWVDERGLPVKFAASQKVAQAGQVSLTSTYRDWGTPAEITAPPAEEVGAFPNGPLPQAQPPR
ncbi:hypothetical protein [Saccharopolyspora gloriosae]|uniref:hypothetical protein n=1 Tax=Saccharopolyspora gloriosae TaxID=455344 RepID=UPI001FB6FD72|nr:hypothetical protein [Saccharopolyspora gloriosae]